MNISQGSPLWQVGLLFFAGIFLLFEMWRGWRAGAVRAGLNFGAFVLSGLIAYVSAQAAAAIFGGWRAPGGWLAGIIVGATLGLSVFFGCWLAGLLFFKKTDQQAVGVFRLLWGGGGAVFGLLLGLFVLWGGITVVRSLGALAAGRSETLSQKSGPPPPVASGLVTLKESLEMGKTGNFLQSVDVFPVETYDLIRKVAQITSDESAMIRFIEYPGIQELIENPSITALLNDPQILEASQKRNIIALLTNPALHKTIEDPTVAAQLKKIDLRAALDYATTNPHPKTPTPKNHYP